MVYIIEGANIIKLDPREIVVPLYQDGHELEMEY